MSTQNHTEELLDELDSQLLGVATDDPDAKPPTFSCDAEGHGSEPIREGETVVLLCVKEDGEWRVENTFCSECSVVDAYSELDDGLPSAVVEGVIIPENHFGASEEGYVLDAFLWELHSAEY